MHWNWSQPSQLVSNITVTPWWSRWRLKSPASRLFTQPFIQRGSKKAPKLRVTGLCAGNSPVNSPHKGPVTRKMFPFDLAIMNAERVSISWRHHQNISIGFIVFFSWQLLALYTCVMADYLLWKDHRTILPKDNNLNWGMNNLSQNHFIEWFSVRCNY